MILATYTFYLFATLMVFFAVVVISARHPVYSVLSLIFCFFNSAGLFVLLGAEFIAMLMVIVYVGAVAVLFLFVVMMLNIDFTRLRAGFVRHLPLGVLVAASMLFELIVLFNYGLRGGVDSTKAAHPIDQTITNTEALGRVLYTEYALIFEVSGLILLVAMVGAIVLTLRVRDGVRKQKISVQTTRTREECVEVVSVERGKGV